MLRDPALPSEVREGPGRGGSRRLRAPRREVGGRRASTSRSVLRSRLGRSSPRVGEICLGIQQDFPVYPAPVAPAGATAGAGALGRGKEAGEAGEDGGGGELGGGKAARAAALY